MKDRLSRRHVVLLGVGHTNAHVLRMWATGAPADADLTCISDYPVVTYSGMLPAVLAGQVPPSSMQIDLVRYCAAVPARLITDPVIGLDKAKRELCFADRPNIPFDVLSIGVGSVPIFDSVEVQGNSFVRIKPMQTFLQRLRLVIESCVAEKSNNGRLQVVIVGSGVAGTEIACCLPPFLRAVTDLGCDLKMITRSKEIAPDLERRTRGLLKSELNRREIAVMTDTKVTQIHPRSLVLHDGVEVDADVVIWATGASPPPLLTKLDLATDDRGFLLTDRTLQSTSLDGVFAVGDTGSMREESVPKAGVYAVRQGPVVWENIRRYLDGKPLQEYHPQRSFLKLINLGDGRAVGQWKRLGFSGHWVMRLKHRIDNTFMEKFQIGSMMSGSDKQRSSDQSMAILDDELSQQCRGCGCKLGSETLAAAFDSDSPVGVEDAAEITRNGDETWIASTDFFSAPFTDAFLSGRIAALHSASDVIVSGGTPHSALANVVIPPGDPNAQRRALSDLMAGARKEFSAMGATIVGGHTIVGPRMELGFTVLGKSSRPALVRKGNLRVGDELMLTKPLGTGVLMAALMRSQCDAEDYQRLVESMLQRQHRWSQVIEQMAIQAGTDITGFGLAGHLLEMLEASNAAATIYLSSLPILPGAIKAVREGIRSTLAPENRRTESQIEATSDCRQRPEFELLFDPQTCGGFLFGVPANRKTELIDLCASHELTTPVCVGHVEAASDNRYRLRVGT